MVPVPDGTQNHNGVAPAQPGPGCGACLCRFCFFFLRCILLTRSPVLPCTEVLLDPRPVISRTFFLRFFVQPRWTIFLLYVLPRLLIYLSFLLLSSLACDDLLECCLSRTVITIPSICSMFGRCCVCYFYWPIFVLLPASGSTCHVVMFVRAVMCVDAKYDVVVRLIVVMTAKDTFMFCVGRLDLHRCGLIADRGF